MVEFWCKMLAVRSLRLSFGVIFKLTLIVRICDAVLKEQGIFNAKLN
jgi:hypothetical protein